MRTIVENWIEEKDGNSEAWVVPLTGWQQDIQFNHNQHHSEEEPVEAESVPYQSRQIAEAIKASRKILELKYNWDDEGSTGYTEITWNRAIQFLTGHIKWLWETSGMRIEAPKILPGPNGSIDIHWDCAQYELLVNIPDDPNVPATFYGDDRGNLSIKGTLDPSAYNSGLLLWLKGKM
jgi:hypothetical protein